MEFLDSIELDGEALQFLAVLIPFVAQYLKMDTWSAEAKQGLVLILSLFVGLAIVYTTGSFDNLFQYFSYSFTIAAISYHFILKNLPFMRKLENAQSPLSNRRIENIERDYRTQDRSDREVQERVQGQAQEQAQGQGADKIWNSRG